MTELNALRHRIHDFGRARVLCLGDVMLDEFVYGDAVRLSPEAPIPVVNVRRRLLMPGGAGNLTRNVTTLGALGTVIGVVGRDEMAAVLRRLLEEQDRLRSHLVPCSDRLTTVKTRFVVHNQQMLRADVEHTGPIEGELAERLLSIYEAELEHADLVVLSDYAKGVLSDAVLRPAIDLARSRRKTVIADPKTRDFSRYRGVYLLMPNAGELRTATAMPCDTDDEAVAAARSVVEQAGVDNLLVTRSERGMTLVTSGGEPVQLPARAREVHDVSGAGDTVAATMAVALASGWELADAARLANVAAGIVVGKVGTATVYPRDLVAEIHRADIDSVNGEIVTLKQALELVDRWRAQGLRVGFTNGCFDLIHPGHVSLLNQAKAACDRLIVGLNSDSSARRLKGPSRPIQSQTARSVVLASLAPVDLVVVFDEDTPLRLIERIKPDVLVKGADYTKDRVVGADLVTSYGGRVLLAKLEEGHSTTGTIARVGGGSS
ncbi:MAG TPA: D-glycero-beta-D-manno-heptose-7-phosphate kinase [Candidatus Polarisedimenticolaceae bacterium]|nr:D-glycero-beta-D-manno-heptose-7-phosphate kinase [Candidatus Polarisedimenticolaceae bacterium]